MYPKRQSETCPWLYVRILICSGAYEEKYQSNTNGQQDHTNGQYIIGQIAVRFDIECSYDRKKHSKYIVEKDVKYVSGYSFSCYSDDQADWGFFLLHATVWRQVKACRGSASWSHSEAQPPSALLLCILSSYQFTCLATSDFDLAEDHLVFVYQPLLSPVSF